MTSKDPQGNTSEAGGEAGAASSNGTTHSEAAKPITIMVPEGTLRKLKIVAIMKETTVSDLLAEAAAAVVKRDLRKVLGKLDEQPA